MRPAGRWASVATALLTAVPAVFAAAVGTVFLSSCGSCDSIVRQTALPVLAAGTFDGVAADQDGHRLFFADQTARGIDVVDVSGSTPRALGTVGLQASPNGLAFAPGRKLLYAGMDGGQVAVIDADSRSSQYLQVIDSVTVATPSAASANPAADLLDYSARDGRLYVGTADAGSVVVVDTATDRVLGSIDLKTPVEQPRFDPADGKLYVTAPHKDALLQIEPASGKVTRTLTLPRCHPSGLAINPSRQLALAACGGSMAVFNLRTGLNELSRTVPGGDLVDYDSTLDRFTVGSSHGIHDSSVGVFSGDARFVGMVASSPGAHGAVFDDRSGLLYAISTAGLLSFSPAACAPPPDWLTFAGGGSVFAAPLLAFGLFLAWYARRRSRGVAPSRPTWEQLRREDLDSERERIREIEDAIYGPEGG